MRAWDRLLQLTASSPFTGTWMSLATAVGALLAVLMARRLIPPDDRPHGGATIVLLLIGLLLGMVRLLLLAVGASASAPGQVVGLLTTFCVAMGAVNTAILFVFEVVPARARGLRLPTILRDLVQMLALVVIVFGSLSHNGMANFGSLVTTSAVLTAVLALSLQSTIANLFAGIVLHMDRVLTEGDWVQVGTRTGRIDQIRWRSTILRTNDGDNVILPNTQLTTLEVHNYSRPLARHRVWVRVPFAYKHPPNDVRQVAIAAARAAPGVLADPPPDCVVVDFTDSAIVYMVRFWVPDFGRHTEVEGEVRTRIWYAARRAGLELANPFRGPPIEPEKDRHLTGEVRMRTALLRRVDLFATLPEEDLELLGRGIRTVTFASGEQIIAQGDPGDSLFVIVEGDVLVSLGDRERHHSIVTLHDGDFFGEMSLVTGEPRNATCSARTDVVCHVIDHAALQPLLAQRPQLAEHLSALLAARQALLERKGGELSARTAAQSDSRNKLLTKIRSLFDLK